MPNAFTCADRLLRSKNYSTAIPSLGSSYLDQAGLTSHKRKALGISKSNLWYQKKQIIEGKAVKVYDKILSKLNQVKSGTWYHSKESAQKIIEAMRIHYNYCRVHSQLGKTPAEQAGSKLELGSNKVESLIRMASKPAN